MNNDRFRDLGRDVVESLGREPDGARLKRQKAAFVAAVGTRTPRRRRWAWLLVPVAVALVAAVTVWVPLGEPRLDFRVGQQQGQAGMWVSSDHEPVSVVFGEGSELEVAAASRVRVARATGKQVRVSVARGRVSAAIETSRHIDWSFAAGPYRVRPLGTRFSMDWDAGATTLDVAVQKGAVRVEGTGLVSGGMTVAAGFSLRVDGINQTVREGSVIEPQPVEEAVEPDSEPKPETSSLPPIEKPRALRFKQLFAREDYEAALEEAERIGIARALTRWSISELWQLADAARYSQRGTLAARVLVGIRKRTRGSAAAGRATFLLGRVAMELQQDPVAASRWFATYLGTHPRGSFAEEAAGRLMVAHDKAGQKAEAHRAARIYLATYPNGAFKELARSLLGEP